MNVGRGRWVRLDPIMPATTDEPGLRAALEAALREMAFMQSVIASGERLSAGDTENIAEVRKQARAAIAATPAASDDRWAGLKRENDMLRQMLAERAASDGSLDVAAVTDAYQAASLATHTTPDFLRALTREINARLSESASEGKTE